MPDRTFRLGLEQADVTLLTGAFVLAKEPAILRAEIPPIVDSDDVPHSLTLEEFTGAMRSYGQHRAALSAEYAARKVLGEGSNAVGPDSPRTLDS